MHTVRCMMLLQANQSSGRRHGHLVPQQQSPIPSTLSLLFLTVDIPVTVIVQQLHIPRHVVLSCNCLTVRLAIVRNAVHDLPRLFSAFAQLIPHLVDVYLPQWIGSGPAVG